MNLSLTPELLQIEADTQATCRTLHSAVVFHARSIPSPSQSSTKSNLADLGKDRRPLGPYEHHSYLKASATRSLNLAKETRCYEQARGSSRQLPCSMDASGLGPQGTGKGKCKAQTTEEGRQNDGSLPQPSVTQIEETRDSTSNDVGGSIVMKHEVGFPGNDDTAARVPAQDTTNPAGGSDARSQSSPEPLEVVLANAPLRVRSIMESSTDINFKNGRLKTMFFMSIHVPSKGGCNHSATMDTGSECNLIKRQKAIELGLTLINYQGAHMLPLGPKILPKFQVTFDWKLLRKNNTTSVKKDFPIFTDAFIVVGDEVGHDAPFNILLGRKNVKNMDILQVDRAMLDLDPGDVSKYDVEL